MNFRILKQVLNVTDKTNNYYDAEYDPVDINTTACDPVNIFNKLNTEKKHADLSQKTLPEITTASLGPVVLMFPISNDKDQEIACKIFLCKIPLFISQFQDGRLGADGL